MSTINQQRQRVEQEITSFVDHLDKSYMRKMQGQMHECAAKCCQDMESSMDSVQQCIERCSKPVNKAQRYVQSELERLQNRLQRCVMDCNDSVKDKMPANPNEETIARCTAQFERCAIKCVDKSIDSLPGLFTAVRLVLSKGETAIPDV